jgi:hypothetical protein
MALKGFLIGGLILLTLCVAIAAGVIWVDVEIFDHVGYNKGLAVDGAQLAGIFGVACWQARRKRER